MSLYVERQFLKTRSYSEIARNAGYSTGYCPHRDGWIIRNEWDEVIGWWWPASHKLTVLGTTFESLTFSDAIKLLMS